MASLHKWRGDGAWDNQRWLRRDDGSRDNKYGSGQLVSGFDDTGGCCYTMMKVKAEWSILVSERLAKCLPCGLFR